jgi:peptide-methionine (R)-S-oxide reductase
LHPNGHEGSLADRNSVRAAPVEAGIQPGARRHYVEGQHMNRRHAMYALGSLSLLAVFPAIGRAAEARTKIERLNKSDAEWQKLLPADRYQVLRHEATEPAGSSPLNDEQRKGTYVCAGCKLPLFDSAHKYESGTGWPSFTQPIEGSMGTKQDYKLILPRTEYHCVRCRGHQGHVFDDGPRPRGERWCNNGLALEFVADGEPLPELVT